jgi:hypothetical protein
MKRSIFISAFFLVFFAELVHAQLAWTPIPFSAPIYNFALGADGSIYVVSGDSVGPYGSRHVSHSTNFGMTWLPFFSGTSYAYDVRCDSNEAVVVLANEGDYITNDTGRNWRPFSGTLIRDIQAAQDGIYVADQYSNLFFTSNYGQKWDTLVVFADGILDDWEGLYCGANNRVIATPNFCSCCLMFYNDSIVPDTEAIGKTDPISYDPPDNIVFGGDGYVYAIGQFGRIRLAPGHGQWEIYDSARDPMPPYLPMVSPNPLCVLSVDSSGTYSSTDHGNSWRFIGDGVPKSYFPPIAFDRHGTGYALSNNGTLYATSYFKSSVATPQPSQPISLYPIPCSTTLTIHSSNIEHVKVFDLLGTLRIEQEYRDHATDPELDVSGLSAGVYSMEVISEGMTSFVRMVKN